MHICCCHKNSLKYLFPYIHDCKVVLRLKLYINLIKKIKQKLHLLNFLKNSQKFTRFLFF